MSDTRCPSMEQTAAGLGTTQGFILPDGIKEDELKVLRELGKKMAELAARPVEDEKKRLWTLLNDLKPERPMVFIDPENGWNEIIGQDQLQCRTTIFRVWEMQLRKEIYWAEEMQDDRVIEPYFNIPYNYSDTGWGFSEILYGDPEHGGSYVWDAPLKSYEEDLPKLHFPEINVDFDATETVVNLAKEIFDGILEVRLRGVWWWTLGMTWEFIKLRGLTNFMMDMYDNPDGVHALMAFLRDGTISKLDFLEKNGLLALNTEGTYVGSGGFGWTTELPAAGYDPSQVRCIDMWGFGESQETVGVSPEMFGEFILPYQIKVLDKFGINCYGCCEPVDPRWDFVKTIPRLRRVSSSPWADKNKMSELLGKDYIQSVKPNPAFLASKIIDEVSARNELREVLQAAKGLPLELMMKDNHTLGGNPRNATRWVEIAREEINRIS